MIRSYAASAPSNSASKTPAAIHASRRARAVVSDTTLPHRRSASTHEQPVTRRPGVARRSDRTLRLAVLGRGRLDRPGERPPRADRRPPLTDHRVGRRPRLAARGSAFEPSARHVLLGRARIAGSAGPFPIAHRARAAVGGRPGRRARRSRQEAGRQEAAKAPNKKGVTSFLQDIMELRQGWSPTRRDAGARQGTAATPGSPPSHRRRSRVGRRRTTSDVIGRHDGRRRTLHLVGARKRLGLRATRRCRHSAAHLGPWTLIKAKPCRSPRAGEARYSIDEAVGTGSGENSRRRSSGVSSHCPQDRHVGTVSILRMYRLTVASETPS
jgi:hypothetical protein